MFTAKLSFLNLQAMGSRKEINNVTKDIPSIIITVIMRTAFASDADWLKHRPIRYRRSTNDKHEKRLPA